MRDALENLEEKTSREHFFPRVTLNGLSGRGNTPDPAFCEAIAICGTTSPRITVLALFCETKTKEIETGTTNIFSVHGHDFESLWH